MKEHLVIPPGTWEYVEELFKKRTVIEMNEFESLLAAFHSEFRDNSPMVVNGKTKKRTRGKNLMDWIKSRLTETNRTITVAAGKVRYIVWCPRDGTVFDNSVMEFGKTVRIIDAFTDLLAKPNPSTIAALNEILEK